MAANGVTHEEIMWRKMEGRERSYKGELLDFLEHQRGVCRVLKGSFEVYGLVVGRLVDA